MSTISVETLELLASKICHDLISPIGAVNNGLEIFEEMGPDAGDEVTELIANSAFQASAKLKAFRMAYGAGGADANIKPSDVYTSIQDIIQLDNKIVQNWDPNEAVASELPPKAFCKILIATLLLAKECLPKGGELLVRADGHDKTVISAKGPDAKLKDGFADSLSLSIEQGDLQPGMTHAYITGILAAHYSYSVQADMPAEGTVTFTINLPAA